MKNTIWILTVVSAALTGCSGDDDTPRGQPLSASPQHVVERNDIVSDQGGALVTDDTLVNAWGLAFNPLGAAWVSSAEKGLSEVYDANGNAVIPAVTIPAPDSGTSAPTGQVFNNDANAFLGDTFVFVTEDGTIAGWHSSNGTQAVIRIDNSADEANYKGVTIAMDAQNNARLFAANFHSGMVDVFDNAYGSVTTSGGFTDADIPSGFAPFNVQEVNGSLIVTYAKQDDQKEDDVAGDGNGYVDMFDADGTLITRLVSQGELNAPWGVALAPSGFGAAPGRLLIGNFGDGAIHVYSLNTPSGGTPSVSLEGALEDRDGNDLAIDGLWALQFGVNAGGFDANTLYFTAGPDDEMHGVFGSLAPTQPTGPDGGMPDGGY